MIEPITAKQALEALENMDDYARMAGITPTGPYETLFTYIKRSNYTIEMLIATIEILNSEITAPNSKIECCSDYC